MNAPNPIFDVRTIVRPDERLLTYYLLMSLLAFAAFPVVAVALVIKYRTMRYRFDDEGVWRGQGLLFRKEVNVAYRRIQDIQLTSNVVQRWFGLSTISIQTAAGSATPEVTIEGVLEADALRDFLYSKMRGVRDGAAVAEQPRPDAVTTEGPGDETLALLLEIRDSLQRLEARLSTSAPPR